MNVIIINLGSSPVNKFGNIVSAWKCDLSAFSKNVNHIYWNTDTGIFTGAVHVLY